MNSLSMYVMKFSKLFLAVALLLPLLSCSTESNFDYSDYYNQAYKTPDGWRWPPWIPGTEGQKEVKVRVLDATTMQPIAGAIVVGGYDAPSISGGMSCAYSESAVSDEGGWATLPNEEDERIRNFSNRYWISGPDLVLAYKRGYKMALPVYRAKGNNGRWYILQTKQKPPGEPNEPPSPLDSPIFGNQKEALLETKERSTIYMMPSTAKTKDERWKELSKMGGGGGGGCFKLQVIQHYNM